MGFEVGKRYKTTVKSFSPGCGLVDIGQEFTCHFVDTYGACWTRDVTWMGRKSLGIGWCVATPDELGSLIVEA